MGRDTAGAQGEGEGAAGDTEPTSLSERFPGRQEDCMGEANGPPISLMLPCSSVNGSHTG